MTIEVGLTQAEPGEAGRKALRRLAPRRPGPH
jgi:hypothetical protein